MTAEQFEQAKRELTDKYFKTRPLTKEEEVELSLLESRGRNLMLCDFTDGRDIQRYRSLTGRKLVVAHRNNFSSDLTALLEQHKEMMLREELIKYDHWAARHLICSSEVLTAEQAVDTYLEELKNVNK
jgi:hypothetical protein